jgi:zinc transporter ZupT
MDEAVISALVCGVVLAMVHLASERLQPRHGKMRWRIISFAAGISIAYLFLHLLPETYKAADHIEGWVFVFLLAGFTIFHLIEKYVYRHAERERLVWDLKEIHSVSFFVYHFVVGVALTGKFEEGMVEGLLFLVPVAFHAGLSTASLSGIHGEMRERTLVRVLLSISTLLGVVFAALIRIPHALELSLVSFVAGVLLYIIVREFLPQEEKGEPAYFVFGLLVFAAVNLAIPVANG